MEDYEKFGLDEDYSYDMPKSENQTQYEETEVKKEEKSNKEPKYITKKVFIVALIITLIIAAVLGSVATVLLTNAGIIKPLNATNYSLNLATGSELSIQEIIAANENSVVAITTESLSTDMWARQYVTSGAGSGVIYSKDGYIVTNNHVIKNANTVKVTLHDGTEYDATVVARDSKEDLAVIKVNAKNLVPVTLAESSSASVGDLVVAIGNPLGTLAGTATEGIVSSLQRDIILDGIKMNLIQISAAINPGNSGGGVFDQHGHLLGIVVAKSTGSDVEGLGFAIPVDTVKTVADSLIKNGHVVGQPQIGIKIVDLTSAQDAIKQGVSMTGVYISEVTSDEAVKAGLRKGDLIYTINGEQVTSSDMIINVVKSKKVGDKVSLKIVRDDDILDIEVKLTEATE